jgi:hypothetical protein
MTDIFPDKYLVNPSSDEWEPCDLVYTKATKGEKPYCIEASGNNSEITQGTNRQ